METMLEAPFLNIFEPGFDYDHEEVALAREVNWYAHTPLGPIVLRHADAWSVLRDPRFIPGGRHYMHRQGITQGPLYDWFVGMLASRNGEDHARLKGLVNKAFTPRFVESLRPMVRSTASSLVDDIVDSDEVCEFVDAFADRLAGIVICQTLGVPTADYDQFHRWVHDIGLVFNTSSELTRSEAAIVGMSGYVTSLIEYRRRHPGEDLLSALIAAEEAGHRLTIDELKDLVLLLFWAGQDTTARQLGRAMVVFAEHPEQWRLLGERPELAPQAVEEVCRWSPQARVTFRFATRDVTYGDLTFGAETMVLIGIVPANRDPRAYEDPERFDISVPRRARQLVFGGGIHHCLGMSMARLELAEALSVLARRLGAPEVAGPITWPPHTAMIHGPLVLPLRFAGRS